jgi:hypothetical protein
LTRFKKKIEGDRVKGTKEIPNVFILVLVSIALGITIVGTIISVTKIVDFDDLFTGAVTTTGQVNLTIASSTSLTNQNATVSFGSGRVNSSCAFCQMDSNDIRTELFSNGTNRSGNTCCVSFQQVTSGFLLENTGNTNLSVGYTCSDPTGGTNCTPTGFVGGTFFPGTHGIQIKITSNSDAGQAGETGSSDVSPSCIGGGTIINTTSWNISNASAYGYSARSNAGYGEATYVAMSPVGHWLCGNATSYPLSSDNSFDAAVLDLNLTVPADAPATGIENSFTLTFNATSPG